MTLKFRLANEYDAKGWNDFVVSNASNAFYNLFAWRNVLIHAYGYTPYYIIAEKGEEISGCFPLMYVKGKLFGDRLISLPFADHGCGPCVKGEDKNIVKFLLNVAERISTKLKAKFIEIHSPSQNWITSLLYNIGYEKLYNYFTFSMNLNRSINDIWMGFEKRVRNAIRRSEKNGIKVVIDNSEDSLKDLYRIHVDNMKTLGTPPHSKNFFKALWKELYHNGLFMNFFAEYEGRRIAAIIIFPYKNSVRWGAGISLTKYKRLNPISTLLWEAIKWAKENGYKNFDLGGSRLNSGNFFFKKGFLGKKCINGQIIELNHLYLFLDDHRTNIPNPDIPKYKLLSNVWRKYMPIPITMWIGPYIRREIAV
jgi:FemAB-related protein (PEP-CTERM system-associated)